MSDYMDDEYDDEEEDELTKLEEEEDYFEGEDSGEGGAKKVFDYKRQLMLNFPAKKMPNKEGIMALHPDITDVEIPRVRNPRFCWVEFDTREKAEKGLDVLSKVRLESGQYLTVSWKADPSLPKRFRRDPDNKKRWILVEGLPHNIKAEELKDSFIGVSRCSVGHRRHKKHIPPGSAILVFNCVKNAMDFFKDEKLQVYKGRRLNVKFLREGPNPKSVARKRRRQRRREYEQRFGGAPHGSDYM